MRKSIVLSTLVTMFLLSGCLRPTVVGSGNVTDKQEELTGFNQLQVSNTFKVKISQADKYRVVVHLDDNLYPYLRLKQTGQTLSIAMAPNQSYKVKRNSMVVEISMPELLSLDMSGASSAEILGFDSAKPLSIEASGASKVHGSIKASSLSADLSGASSLELKGSAQSLNLEASGASDAELADFPVAQASASLSGASDATVQVTGKLDINTSGASTLAYLGEPTLGTTHSSGASSIRKK